MPQSNKIILRRYILFYCKSSTSGYHYFCVQCECLDIYFSLFHYSFKKEDFSQSLFCSHLNSIADWVIQQTLSKLSFFFHWSNNFFLFIIPSTPIPNINNIPLIIYQPFKILSTPHPLFLPRITVGFFFYLYWMIWILWVKNTQIYWI